MRLKSRLCRTLIVLISLAVSDLSLAEPRAELIARMEELKISIDEAQAASEHADQKAKDTEGELKKIKLEILRLKKEEKELLASLAKLERSQTVAEREIQRLTAQQDKIKRLLFQRIRAVYLVPKSSVVAQLVAHEDAASLGVLNHYMEVVYRHDIDLAQQVKGLAKKIATESTSIGVLVSKQKTVAADIRNQQGKVAERLATQERISAAAKIEQENRESAVVALRAKLLRFEATLTGLTGGSYEVTEGDSSSVRQVDESFDGPGLSKKSRGVIPATGKVVTRYGGIRKDRQPSKGIEISTVGLARVKAVGAGKVVFSGSLPGLERTVVIDHGQRTFSIYGRLAAAQCSVGNIIEARDAVGEAGGEKPFYFEIRIAGNSVDPRAFIQLP